MRSKFWGNCSLLLGLCSFAILILGFFHFDNTVSQKRTLMRKINHYQPGDHVDHMRATVSGRTENGMLVLQDFEGTKIVTDLKDESFHPGNLVALKRKIGKTRLFKVDTMEAYPGITMKIALSLIAMIFLFWRLLGGVKVSTRGLILPHQKT